MTLTSGEASSRPGVTLPRRPLAPVLLRMLEFAMGALFLYLGGTKLLGSTAEVRLFHDYGWGQWFRYVTGVIELAGALLLIVPRLGRASALMAVMVVATGIELFVLHRPPMAATACPVRARHHRVEAAATSAVTVGTPSMTLRGDRVGMTLVIRRPAASNNS